MVCLSRPYPYKFFEGCLPNIFAWAILEYFVPNAGIEYFGKKKHPSNLRNSEFSEVMHQQRLHDCPSQATRFLKEGHFLA